jgi:hypothetical protein
MHLCNSPPATSNPPRPPSSTSSACTPTSRVVSVLLRLRSDGRFLIRGIVLPMRAFSSALVWLYLDSAFRLSRQAPLRATSLQATMPRAPSPTPRSSPSRSVSRLCLCLRVRSVSSETNSSSSQYN